MVKKRGIKGKSVEPWVAEWEPLLDLAPSHVADFMWMFAVELRGGARVQAYKHYWTRNYLHLDGDGRAYVYVEPERYEQVEPTWLLAEVLGEHLADKDWFDIAHPHRPTPGQIRVEWTDSAMKNGISRERSQFVVQHCGMRFRRRAPLGSGAPRPDEFRTLFVGVDEDGAELEVAAIAGDYGEAFVVFHAAPLRDAYQHLLARGERWRQ